MAKKPGSQQNLGSVLFIIPRADDYLDPICNRLFHRGFTPVLLHHGKAIVNHQEKLSNIIKEFGDIVCAAHPDDLDFCDDWYLGMTENIKGNIGELLRLLRHLGIPIVAVAMEWCDHIVDDRVEIENTGEAFIKIMNSVGENTPRML